MSHPESEHRCPICGATPKRRRQFCSRQCAGAHRRRPPLDRIMERRVITDTGCWIWTTVKPTEYGHVKLVNGSFDLVHRIVYQALVGPIPAERPYIDHLCREKRCFNPAHLEPVTNRENAMRGRNPNVLLHLAGKCKYGHDYAANSTPRPDGKLKGCRVCARERARLYRKQRAS